MMRKKSATFFGSVIAAKWPFFIGGKAPFKSGVGLRSARPVATAYRNTWPQLAKTRRAVSGVPRFSIAPQKGLLQDIIRHHQIA